MATVQEMSVTEIESTMSAIQKMILVGTVFVAVGYVLLLVAGLEDGLALWGWADSTKMWFKLGGIGHILVGIFISLVGIVRTLGLVPHRLGAQLD